MGTDIILADGVTLGHDVMVVTSSHPIVGPQQSYGRDFSLPVTIGRCIWFEARSLVLPGATTYTGAIDVAGAAVTKDMPENKIVSGVPARVIHEIDHDVS